MNLKRRLEIVESKLEKDHITMRLKDGSIYRFRGDLFEAMGEVLSNPNSPLRAKIMDCVSSDESGQIISLIQALLHPPIPRGASAEDWNKSGELCTPGR